LSVPDSRDKVYAAITLANLVQPVPTVDATWLEAKCQAKQVKAEELINKAVLIARRLKDTRSESFALGKLAHIYECRQDYQSFKLDPTG